MNSSRMNYKKKSLMKKTMDFILIEKMAVITIKIMIKQVLLIKKTNISNIN